MKLIVGLGNPGIGYKNTRHNIGFLAVEEIAEKYNIRVDKLKFKALIGEGKIGDEKVVLMMPQTYMNLSGEAILACKNWYKLQENDIIVLYDDISLDVGQLRIRREGSAGGHNGIKNTILNLGTEKFARIKIGVGAKPEGYDLADYVLGKFDHKEREILKDTLQDVVVALKLMLEGNMDTAMNRYNGRLRR
jgi:PTH1 family peptidyl-tRNA hydrolase